MFKNKKAQLGSLEAKFFFYGFILGLILVVALVFMANKGILPFKLTFLCPTAA